MNTRKNPIFALCVTKNRARGAVYYADRFPADFGEKSRQYGSENYKKILQLSTKSEADIKDSYWIDITKADKDRYDQIFLDVRVKLRDDAKVYDKSMLSLMRRLRCSADKTRSECAQKRTR